MASRQRLHLVGGSKGQAPIVDYNRADTDLLDITMKQIAQAEFDLAKRIGTKLTEVYPNRQWGVDVDATNQMVVIMCPSLSATKGYHLHMREGTVHDLERRAVKAAGEILERHNVSRGKIIDPNSFDHMPADLKGNVIGPDSDPEPLH